MSAPPDRPQALDAREVHRPEAPCYVPLLGLGDAGNPAARWLRPGTAVGLLGMAILLLGGLAACLPAAPLAGILGTTRALAGRAEVSLPAEAGCTVNIFLVRHCDKNPPWDKDPTPEEVCTVDGELRGEHMAALFSPGGRFPVPSRLFARTIPPRHFTSRDMYLLWPLAQRLGVWVNTSFAEEDSLAFAQMLLDEREAMCKEAPIGSIPMVLVSWNHCTIPALTQAMGCHADICLDCWDDADFDTVLQLTFRRSAGGPWTLDVRKDAEGFKAPRGLEGQRECKGSPAASARFGFPCRPWTGKRKEPRGPDLA